MVVALRHLGEAQLGAREALGVPERIVLVDLPFTLASANVGDAKEYGPGYAEFRSNARLPADFLDRKLSSRYALHFYSEAERADIRDRWSR